MNQELRHIGARIAAYEVDYPEISDDATVKLDITMVGTFQWEEILNWFNETEEAEDECSLHTAPRLYHNGQHDLDATVVEYLMKKDYTDTRSVLLAESWAIDESMLVRSAATVWLQSESRTLGKIRVKLPSKHSMYLGVICIHISIANFQTAPQTSASLPHL